MEEAFGNEVQANARDHPGKAVTVFATAIFVKELSAVAAGTFGQTHVGIEGTNKDTPPGEPIETSRSLRMNGRRGAAHEENQVDAETHSARRSRQHDGRRCDTVQCLRCPGVRICNQT